MSDFTFKVVADASDADKSIEEVTRSLDKLATDARGAGVTLSRTFDRVADDATDAAKAIRNTGLALDTIGLGAQNQVGRLARLEDSFQRLTGRIGAGIGAIDDFAKKLAPWNQVMELGGKALNFVNDGLEAYAKTSPQAAAEVASLTKEFGNLKQSVMAAVGELAVMTLKAIPSIDELKKQIRGLPGVFEDAVKNYNAWNAATSDFKNLQFERTLDDLIAKLPKVADETKKAAAATREHAEALSLETRILQGLDEPFDSAMARARALNNLFNDGLLTLPEWNTEMGKVRDTLIEMGKIEPTSIAALGSVAPIPGVAEMRTPGQGGGVDFDATKENLRLAREGIAEMQAALDKLNADKARAEFQSLGQSLRPVADSLIDMFKAWDFSAQKLSDTLKDVAIQILKVSAIRALGGAGATGGAGVLVGLLGGANGFDYLSSSKALQLPGFAYGGDMVMGGSGGTDSKIAMWRMTPGESLHVRTPEQRRQAAAQAAPVSAGPTEVHVHMQNDRRDLVEGLDSREGQRVIARLDRRMGSRRR